jgi:RNA polymerase sigma-70 factor (ECF subfamily)
MLRARQARREEPLGPHVPDPIVSPVDGGDPEHEALGPLRAGRRADRPLAGRGAEGRHPRPQAGRSRTVLDPQVVLRTDGGEARPSANHVIRGAVEVAGRALTFSRLSPYVQPVLVNGVAGVLVAPGGRPFSVMAFTVAGGRIAAIDALADPERLERLVGGAPPRSQH